MMCQFLKRVLFVLVLFTSCILINAQNTTRSKKEFLRVYNLEGKKISKGHLVHISDSLLILEFGNKRRNLNYKQIGRIKTKRSTGNNVLTGSLIGGVTGAIIGLTTSREETKTGDGGWLFGEYEYTTGTSPGTGAVLGGGAGLVGGALIGLGGSLFKNSDEYIIDGNWSSWKSFVAAIKN